MELSDLEFSIENFCDEKRYIFPIVLSKVRGVNDLDVNSLLQLSSYRALELGLTDIFLARLKDQSQIEYLLPSLKNTLKETYGLVLYFDQYFKVMHQLVGFDENDSIDFYHKAKRSDKRTKEGREFFNKLNTNTNMKELEVFLTNLHLIERIQLG